MRRMLASVAAATALVSTAAFAAVTFDETTGAGFVGKGDVQYTLGLNNAQVQAATLVFTYASTTETVTEWTCDRDAGPQTQERSSTVTSSTQGVVSAVARVKNQITGYTLSGFVGTPTTAVVATDGPAPLSCPSGWTAINASTSTSPVGDAGLLVNGVPLVSPPAL